MNWQALFFSADGRVGQKDFWIGVLILFGLAVLSLALHLAAPFIWLLMLYPWVCLAAKRLHDFGKSGWLVMIPIAVGCLALFLGVLFGGVTALAGILSAANGAQPEAWRVILGALGVMFAFLGVASLVKLAFLLWVGLSPGDPGPNRYGPAQGQAASPPATTTA